MKIFAWIVLGIVILIIATLLLYLLLGAILFKIIFSRRSITARVLNRNLEEKMKKYNVDLCWWDKVKFSKVTTQSFDGLKLVGHLFEANSNRTVIVFHGFGQTYIEMQQYCKFFYDKNFSVLAVDARAHGESEGTCISFGWTDRKDVVSWVKFVNEKRPNDKILLFGLSMGGATVCMASGEKELQNVVGIVSDCAFDNADRQISFVMKRYKFVPKFFKKIAYSFTKRVHGFDVMQADAIKQVKQTKFPIFFIHGQADGFVPVENLNNLYSSTPQNLRGKFVVPEADHAMSYVVAGAVYEKKMCDFLKSHTSLFS